MGPWIYISQKSLIRWSWNIDIKQHDLLSTIVIRIPSAFTKIFHYMFTRNYIVHSHDITKRYYIHVPMSETTFVKMSVCYTGRTIWDHRIKFIDDYNSLKNKDSRGVAIVTSENVPVWSWHYFYLFSIKLVSYKNNRRNIPVVHPAYRF